MSKEIKVADEQQRKIKRVESLVKATFGTQQGKDLMEYLESVYLAAPVFNPNVSGDKQATAAAFREGENSVIRKLKLILEKE